MAIFYTCHGPKVHKPSALYIAIKITCPPPPPPSTFRSLSPNSNSNILSTKKLTAKQVTPPFLSLSPDLQKEVQRFYLYENSVWNSFWNCSWDWDFAANTTSSRNPLCGNSFGTRDRYVSKFSAASFFLSCRL